MATANGSGKPRTIRTGLGGLDHGDFHTEDITLVQPIGGDDYWMSSQSPINEVRAKRGVVTCHSKVGLAVTSVTMLAVVWFPVMPCQGGG